MLVQGARKQGEMRVRSGVEKCLERDEYYRKSIKEDEESKGGNFVKLFEESMVFGTEG